ncbi:MAG: lipopolysaccharide biosynthesis protein [Actinobacteria bacterium]|nr:lipopolysaccharide biosynthesis protein [Actinomycetota bacterium]
MNSADDLSRTALRSLGWVALDKWGTRLVSLAVFVTLGRLLAPRDFGLVALAAVFTAILGTFVDGGFSQVLVQRVKVTSLETATAFWTSVGISVVMYAALAALARPLALLYGEPRLDELLYVLGLQLPIAALSGTPAALLQREFAFRGLMVRQLIGTVGGAVGGLVAALSGLGAWALVVQAVGSVSLSCATLWVLSGWRPTLEYSVPVLRSMLGFGLAALGTEAVNLANSQADKLIVGTLLGPAALGYYYVGSRIVNLVSELMTVVIAQVSFTTFSRMQHEPRRMASAFNKATFASATIALPVFGALAIQAPVIVPLTFGDQWTSSVVVMQALAPAAALNSIIYFDKSALLARGFARDTFLLALGNAVLGVVLVFAAAPWGIVGVAASRSVRQFIYWPVRITVLRLRLGVQPLAYLRQFLKPGAAALLAIMVMMALDSIVAREPLWKMTLPMIGFLTTYAALLYVLSRREIANIVRSAIGPRRNASGPERS